MSQESLTYWAHLAGCSSHVTIALSFWCMSHASVAWFQFCSVHSLTRVQLFVTPWTTAHQASLSITNSWNLPTDLCPLSWWCHPTISSYVSPSPPAFNLSQHQGLFKWVSSLHQVAKALAFQLQQQPFQWIFRTDFLQDWLVRSPCSPRDSQESSPTT